MQVLVFAYIYQGAILAHVFEPQPLPTVILMEGEAP